MDNFRDWLGTITSVGTIVGMIILVYVTFRKPTEELEKKQIISDGEEDKKASILAQQVQWEKESNEKKFCDMVTRMDAAFTLAQNHIHTVDVKTDKLAESINSMSNRLTELTTIISERIPKK